jgi:chromosome condensin MukBEF ATPase and DNA-binding subunit MukB
MPGSVLRNLQVFAGLCGQMAMPNVILATTMWEHVEEETGARREKQLNEAFWKEMIVQGCTTNRFEGTYDSAWGIIDSLAQKDKAPVLLSREIVDARLRLNETKAGIVLESELWKLVLEQKEAVQRILEQAKEQDNELVVQELNQRKAEIEAKIQQTAEQLQHLTIPFSRRLRLFFKKHN